MEKTKEWSRPSDVIMASVTPGAGDLSPFEKHIELLTALDNLVGSTADQVAFKRELQTFSTGVVQLASNTSRVWLFREPIYQITGHRVA